jgi:hypothetical protein
MAVRCSRPCRRAPSTWATDGFTGSTPCNLTETFTANTISSSVSLSGTLTITPALDTLLFTNLTPTTLTLPSGQTLTVTPQPLGPLTSSFIGQSIPYTLQASFALSPAVPELDPGSLAGALTLASGGLMVLTGRRRRRAAA